MTVLENLYYGNPSPLNEYEQSKETVTAIKKNNKKFAVLQDYLIPIYSDTLWIS